MDIRFVSSMTPDDETHIASLVVDLVGSLLDHLPITYTLSVVTTAGVTFQRTHVSTRHPGASDDPFGDEHVSS
jgi:hypothetical protein